MALRTVLFLALVGIFSVHASVVTHHPQAFLTRIEGKPNEGALIVKHFCANCHAVKPLIPLGAPRIGVKVDWQERLTHGLDVLFNHTAEGYRAMPPRGGCFECSDSQLKKAIAALLPRDK
jgi:cytochrome c5